MPTDDVCAEVIYGETSVLRAPDHEAALVTARSFIGAVVYARYDADPSRFAPRKKPSADALKDPTIAKHWKLCNEAAAAAHHVQIGTCRHYAIWWKDAAGNYPAKVPKRIHDDWPYTQKDRITESFGPFKYYGDGGGEMYVFKYCGVS
jgi:hypothetical protein